MMFSMGVYPKIHGYFPKNKQYIVMMNHSSFLDMFIYPLVLQGKWTGITASENFKYPILSLLLKKIDAIPIKRTNKIGAIKTIQIAEQKLMSGYHIGIMPEGERTLNGKMLPFKKGGFHMALNTKTPILPVGVSGAFNAKPKNRWWIKPGNINVSIGDPISVSHLNKHDINSLIQLVENKIKKLSGEDFEN
jgi:1-acyl-sn-glycerol-3-phosphate acyltransferase